ncbi:arylsulfatase [Thermogemmata fonticola]|uniref:Arylsulfatase n=1 Tax=Thermogemmata fonticola TaxID=2755323 RepID=A0A7V8VH42_9BACT|nr:arylsulfatase [Thermogemmata fonticola]MBA2227836.1 arylsulfatase [Thermogemmata fonticola]
MRAWLCGLGLLLSGLPVQAAPPNLVLIISDDQGYGDLGCHGNPVLRTPHLDRLARQSVWLKNFYVSPVCSPTRASLLTGLYSYRTGVVDTYLGRALMRPQVRTLAEHLAQAGYRTGLFGKWHLGDNYPLRPEDRGFHETLWHLGGGLAQPSDPPWVDPRRAYFDPVLQRNGQEVQGRGYCTDLFTRSAIQFILRHKDRPFFAYIAYNAPHAPFQVPPEGVQFYRQRDLTPRAFPKIGQPWWNGPKKLDTEAIAAAYGMIENLDANIGRLLQTLHEHGLAERTLVVFLTDNGPGGVRWNAGLRGRKGTVYEGGIRVPCYVCWPHRLKGGQVLEWPLAHIDLVPTLCELCGVPWREPCDGRSFAPWLLGSSEPWPDRTLFFQWHRGDTPEQFRAFAARGPRYKLVQAAGTGPGSSWKPRYELFDLSTDPYEETDLAEKMPEMVERLRREYAAWFTEVTRQGFAPPRLVLGSPQAPEVRLSRQDWRGPRAGWSADSLGHWAVHVARPGRYRFTLHAAVPIQQWELLCEQAQPPRQHGHGTGQTTLCLDSLRLQAGEARLEIRLNDPPVGPTHVIVEYLGP